MRTLSLSMICFGEDAGDGFLKFIGLELEKIFGRIDIVSCRYEADHFVILTWIMRTGYRQR